ncbi:MAG: outer membrane lipoprotein carrier protein LolA [Salinivirgaceae bacterium]|nr:outer membrane lipoprotein carrier protein LolA [Salinivirgaceae bacterium]
MKHLLTAIILLATFGFANAQKDAAIDKILKTNEKYQTISCDFKQTKTMAMVDKKIESEGVLYFNRADKLKMDYSNPAGNLLLISGESLLMIQTAEKTTSTPSRTPRCAT